MQKEKLISKIHPLEAPKRGRTHVRTKYKTQTKFQLYPGNLKKVPTLSSKSKLSQNNPQNAQRSLDMPLEAKRTKGSERETGGKLKVSLLLPNTSCFSPSKSSAK